MGAPVVHFEIITKNAKGIQSFYKDLFDWNIDASTHLAKLNQTVNVPQGSFTGSVDIVTGELTGHIIQEDLLVQ